MKRNRGFTLFEVLIALVLVVMLMASLSSTLSIAWHQKRAAENAVESVRDLQAVSDIVVDSLKDALPPWVDEQGSTESDLATTAGTTPGTGVQVTNDDGTTTEELYIPHLVGPFHGDATSIGFFASGSEPKSKVTGSVRWIEFAAVSGYGNDGNLSLVRRVETDLLRDDWDVDNPSSNGLPDEVLIHHVVDLKFQYADVDGNLTDTWYSEDNQNILPYAVVMEVTLAPLGESKDNRVIHRVASIICAAPPVQTDDTTGTTGSTTGGITNGPNTGFGR